MYIHVYIGANIFLSSNRSIKLGDFGLSVQLQNFNNTIPKEIKKQAGTVRKSLSLLHNIHLLSLSLIYVNPPASSHCAPSLPYVCLLSIFPLSFSYIYFYLLFIPLVTLSLPYSFIPVLTSSSPLSPSISSSLLHLYTLLTLSILLSLPPPSLPPSFPRALSHLLLTVQYCILPFSCSLPPYANCTC